MYLYRPVDKSGNTVDFLLKRTRQRMSAQSFSNQSDSTKCTPIVIIIDKTGNNTGAVKIYNKHSFSKIKI